MRRDGAQRRVVVTGIGVICPAGDSPAACWESFTSGRAALRTLAPATDVSYPVSVIGRIDEALIATSEDLVPGTDRTVLLAKIAARAALVDANINPQDHPERRIAFVLGTGAGPAHGAEEAYLAFAAKGWKGLRPTTVPRSMFNAVSAQIAIDFKLTGSQLTVAAACASSNMAIARAADLIRFGRESMVLTGGAEAPLCPSVFGSWVAMRVLSASADSQRALLPFHKKRNGLVLAEGAAMFVLEDLDAARARGAKIYGEILGYGESNDGCHITRPDKQGQVNAIRACLRDAEITPGDVDYINAHGTGTIANDECETEAIKEAFGDHARNIPISSTKSVVGHSLGASGAIEVIAILGAFQHQLLPPTANLDEQDPKCDLDYLPCEPRRGRVEVALSNSFAFGGANSVLAFRRYEE